MKKLISALLVLSMILALAGTAMAACKIEARTWVQLKCDANSYSAAKSSKKTTNVAKKDSRGYCTRICGKYAKVRVNEGGDTYCWFRVADLKPMDKGLSEYAHFIWVKGGKGMSTHSQYIFTNDAIKGLYVKVSGHTNLRKQNGLDCKSQGVVKKGQLLKLTGRLGSDDRPAVWYEVCYKGKKLWVSSNFLYQRPDPDDPNNKIVKYYDKDGNCVYPKYDI